MELQQRVPTDIMCLVSPLAELTLHAAQLLLFLLYFLVQMTILVLQKI